MAEVILTIKDVDRTGNIGVEIDLRPNFPESALLMTNAQLVGRDLIMLLHQLGKQVNTAAAQSALVDASTPL